MPTQVEPQISYSPSEPSEGNSVLIVAKQDNDEIANIRAFTPKDVQIYFSSTWNSPFENAAGDFFNNIAQVLPGRYIGVGSAKTQSLTKALWQGTSPLTMRMPLEFRYVSDEQGDVWEPARRLLSLVLPKAGGLTLKAPGPSGGLLTSIRIGRMAIFPQVILVNVESNFRMIMGPSGLPSKVVVNITFQTDRVLTRDNWMDTLTFSGFPGSPPDQQAAEDVFNFF